ncbi:uncharacterized protein BKA55DRAFT_600133 [Fusarium redolens]|uniref:Galactose oxidase n=1 Tax=Fusarium redolens TaxID=48865 RepID=A0A9P9JPC3_FUSRE|nr:uncharacterized protein BKA55DRAFT_600133 [Fusarium redolens]KAH7207900.1 hypothetical protein BKA55DRAFT_600133 [Fusarium redolens]
MRASSPILRLAVFSLFDIAATASACKSNEWINLAPIPTARQEHGTMTDLLQFYDIPSDTWITKSAAPHKVNHPNLAVVGNKLYLLGGLVDGPAVSGVSMNWVASATAHVYDVTADTWNDLPPMPNGTEKGSSIVGVHGEMLYLAGGMTVLQDTYQDAVNTFVSFNTTSSQWQRVVANAAELPASRQHGTGAVIGDTFYVVGGRWFGQMNTRDTVFELDLTKQENGWKDSAVHMPVARGGIYGAAVGDKFYAFGGEGNPNTSNGVFNQSEAFNTESQQWTELKPMAVPRHGTQAASVGSLVYIPGGGLQQDGKAVSVNGSMTFMQLSSHFDAYCV